MGADLVANKSRIIAAPASLVGKPVVRGTRIPVPRVHQHRADDLELQNVYVAFPRLTADAPYDGDDRQGGSKINGTLVTQKSNRWLAARMAERRITGQMNRSHRSICSPGASLSNTFTHSGGPLIPSCLGGERPTAGA